LFIGAGVFLDRLAGLAPGIRPAWLLQAVVTLMILAAGAPTLISQYRDGQRWDFRGAARWLEPQLVPGDIVYSDQPQVVSHYLPNREIFRLVADSVRLAEAARQVREHEAQALWIVAPAPSHAFRTNPGLTGLNDWVYGNCQLRTTVGVGRLDFRQNFLQVFRCPPLRSGRPGDPGRG
jgi:hypothetical protein